MGEEGLVGLRSTLGCCVSLGYLQYMEDPSTALWTQLVSNKWESYPPPPHPIPPPGPCCGLEARKALWSLLDVPLPCWKSLVGKMKATSKSLDHGPAYAPPFPIILLSLLLGPSESRSY